MSLTQRVGDLKLALKLLLWSWVILSPAAIGGAVWLMSPAGLSGAWRDYILARLVDFAGLGQVPVLPVAGTWVKPAAILGWTTENFPAATLARWDADFLTLALIPLIMALILSMLGSVIHLHRKKGTSK